MSFSWSIFSSLLCSCLIHSVALGIAAALVVSPWQSSVRTIKVTLLQRAIPLPIGGGEVGKGEPTPAPEKTQTRTSQLPARSQPRPRPHVVVKKISRPPIIAPPKPVDAPVQVAAIAPPPSVVVPNSDEATAGEGGNGKAIRDGEGLGGSGGKAGGNGASSGSGQGAGGRASARPAYGVNPKPPYPLLARRLGAQGVVLLRVQVREDGSVAAVELVRSSGFAMLDESASRTVRESWSFLPARIDGSPVASWVEVPIRFVLEDS